MKNKGKSLAILLSIGLALAAGCGKSAEISSVSENNSVYANTKSYDANIINLNGNSATLNGTAIEEFDYTWHCDPSVAHDEVKNAPAEY